MPKLTVLRIKNLDSIVIKQTEGRGFFLSAPDSLIISIPSLAFIIKFLITNDFMSHKVLEGILEEYHSSGGKFDFERNNDNVE